MEMGIERSKVADEKRDEIEVAAAVQREEADAFGKLA
jgi:hypothetical protein